MGDVLGLIEKAEEIADASQAAEMFRKIRRNEFTLADYRDQLRPRWRAWVRSTRCSP